MLYKVKSSIHIEDKHPLILTIPKPSLVPAKPGHTFGFKLNSVTSRSMTGVAMSNCEATNTSPELSEIVTNSEDNSHQAAGMDMDPSNNIDKGSFGMCSFPTFSHIMLIYIPRRFWHSG